MAPERDNIPDEVICKIFSLLNPIDVVKARLVSKRMRNITYDRELWKALYANACFLRPPGPFQYQSTPVLERNLLRSAWVAETWTTRPVEEVSHSEIRLDPGKCAFPRLVFGRWVISYERNGRIISHDMNQKCSQQIIWEAENRGPIQLRELFSITSMEGEAVYVIVSESLQVASAALGFRVLLLEFRVNCESLEFASSRDIPATGPRFWTGVLGDSGPFLYLQGLGIIFDTRTRVFHTFPQFSTQLKGVGKPRQSPHRIVLTSTYIFGLTYVTVSGSTNSKAAIIQAFTSSCTPRLSPTGVCTLRLTHECISIREAMFPTTLIRDSVIDTLTGTTILRFMTRYNEDRKITFRCIDFTLPKPRDDSVLPISFGVHGIATLSMPGKLSLVQVRASTSSDGYVLGYYQVGDLATKFKIDATREICQAVVSEHSSLHKYSRHGLTFDGMRGRLYYGTERVDGAQGYDVIHVIDVR